MKFQNVDDTPRTISFARSFPPFPHTRSCDYLKHHVFDHANYSYTPIRSQRIESLLNYSNC